ncbi:MAG: helix-turn-helix domain-containing protein [Nitrososphaeraceae archaeon]
MTVAMQNLIILTNNPEEYKNLLKETFQELLQEKEPLEESSLEQPLTTEGACKFLNISKTTLCDWKKKGIVPYFKLGKRVYFEKAKLIEAGKNHEKYLRINTRQSN